jgi:hypothetical protein
MIMNTSAECQKIAEAKISEAEGQRDKRRANRLISAANGWLILARGLKSLEIKEATRMRRTG